MITYLINVNRLIQSIFKWVISSMQFWLDLIENKNDYSYVLKNKNFSFLEFSVSSFVFYFTVVPVFIFIPLFITMVGFIMNQISIVVIFAPVFITIVVFIMNFISFVIINFPIFNVADIYVTVSTFLFVILFLFYYKESDFSFLSFRQQNKFREFK